MRAINHAMTGAIIGLTLPAPLALPLALVSHFVLDAIPHFGSENTGPKTKLFNYILVADALLCVALVAVLFQALPGAWLVPSVCAFLGTSPDFMWIAKYLDAQAGRVSQASSKWLLRFHTWIQWFERPAGIVVEVAWAAGAIAALNHLL